LKKALPAVILLLALSNLGLAANTNCSNADLKGDYGFTISGETLNSNEVTYTHGIAMTNFDGKGNLTQADFVTFNGILAPGVTDPDTGFNTAESGTYHVNSDCTGRAEIHFLPPPGVSSGLVVRLAFVLSNQGRTSHGRRGRDLSGKRHSSFRFPLGVMDTDSTAGANRTPEYFFRGAQLSWRAVLFAAELLATSAPVL
jgi:hypothetical protein